MSGVILVVGALAIAGMGINFGIDFESGTRITTPLEQPASVDEVRDALAGSATATRRSRRSRTRSSARTSSRSRPRARAGRGQRGRSGARRGFGVAATDFTADSIGPTFGEQIARTARHRDHRLADPDLDLHRAPLRVQVRGAGADRAGPRPPHHRGRLRAGRAGGDDVDRRGAAHHPGLLALRHDHRVRPNTRERAAHAARHVLADREPLDVRGARRARW